MTDSPSQLDRYLDGTLTEAERTSFEQRLAQDAELAEAVALHAKIDASIERSSAMSEELLARCRAEIESVESSPDRVVFSFRTMTRYAAMVAIIIGATWLIWSWQSNPSRSGGPRYVLPKRTVASAYEYEVANGFEPVWVCETDEEFANTFDEAFGQAILLDPLPDDIAAVGLSYSFTLSKNTIMLLARVDDAPVLVFVDKDAGHEVPSVPSTIDLSLHKRVIGPLVLYELTPHDEPAVIDSFYAVSD